MADDFERLAEQLDIPRPESYNEKEVYAFLGLAVFQSVGLERLVVALLTIKEVKVARVPNGSERLDLWDHTYAKFAKMTLGQLLNVCESAAGFDERLKRDVRVALPIRNRIIHRLAWDDAEKFCTERGCKSLITDLRRNLVQLGKASVRAEAIIEQEGRLLGVTEEWLAAKQKELLERVSFDDETA